MLVFSGFYLMGNLAAKRKPDLPEQIRLKYGGDEEDRTLDLTDANRTLSQLSYAPKDIFYFITPFQICTDTTYCENNEFVYKNKCKLHEQMSIKTVWVAYQKSELQIDNLFPGSREQ